jgi:hypothetical protein
LNRRLKHATHRSPHPQGAPPGGHPHAGQRTVTTTLAACRIPKDHAAANFDLAVRGCVRSAWWGYSSFVHHRFSTRVGTAGQTSQFPQQLVQVEERVLAMEQRGRDHELDTLAARVHVLERRLASLPSSAADAVVAAAAPQLSDRGAPRPSGCHAHGSSSSRRRQGGGCAKLREHGVDTSSSHSGPDLATSGRGWRRSLQANADVTNRARGQVSIYSTRG